MTTLLLLFALCSIHEDDAIVDHVDRVEVNHFYDDQARLVFRQLIFWDWNAEDSRFDVVAWRLLKGQTEPRQTMRGVDWEWRDFKRPGHLRRVVAPIFLRTWTQYDPEVANRDELPEAERRGLRP